MHHRTYYTLSIDRRVGKRSCRLAAILSEPHVAGMDTREFAALASLVVALILVAPRLSRIPGGAALRYVAVWLALAVGLGLLYRLVTGE